MAEGQAVRRAVITGGGTGIGRSVALAFAGSGHTVTVLGRSRQTLDETAKAAVGLPGTVEALVCDVTDPSAVTTAFGEVGPVDILVNSAGMAESDPIGRVTIEAWDDHLRLNATGPFLCTQAALASMRERDFGRIVTVASIAGLASGPYIAAYTASKHAAVGLMRAVASEVAGTGVTANCVCPAYVRTPMTDRSIAGIVARTSRTEADAEAALAGAAPLGRLVEAEEVAAAVTYLTSDDAAAVNGQSIVLDGGGIQQ